jgi:hypothetical protein
VVHRASRPSRPDKARRLGYRAKEGKQLTSLMGNRLRDLQGQSQKGWPQEVDQKGHGHGKALLPGCQPAQILTKPEVHRRRKSRSKARVRGLID